MSCKWHEICIYVHVFINSNMKIKNINSLSESKELINSGNRTFLLLYKSGTEQSDCAKSTLTALKGDFEEVSMVGIADVNHVRDIHPEYSIETVPTLVEFKSGRLVNIYKGCNGKDFYQSVFTGGHFVGSPGEGKPVKRVTVYSTPSCSWCTTLKNYLKEQKIRFKEIDVSVDQKAAAEMVRRSGQQGVPQTDINGRMIIGFDKKKIDDLLEIGR